MKKVTQFMFILILVGLVCFQISFAANDTIVWKFCTGENAGSLMQLASQKYLCDEVFDKTNGGLKIEMYPSFALGGERDLVQSLQTGSLEVARLSEGITVTFFPGFGFVSLPFIIDNEEHFNKIIKTDIWKNLVEETQQHGVIFLGTSYLGGRLPVFTKKPITKPEDFKGLNMRTMENEIQIKTMKALGATPVPLPYPDIYNALRTKLVDGMFNDPLAIDRLSAYEVAPYLTNLPLFASLTSIAISKIAFEKLPEKYQDVVREIFIENIPKVNRIGYQGNIASLKEMVIERYPFYNNIFDLTPFRKATKSVYDDFENKYPDSKNIIDLVDSLR